MPNVFSTKTMNISTSALACQEDVKRWPHLDGITLPDTVCDGEVNLLIGVGVWSLGNSSNFFVLDHININLTSFESPFPLDFKYVIQFLVNVIILEIFTKD